MKQLIIPVEHEPGQLAKVAGLLAEHEIEVLDIDGIEDGEHGFISLRVDRYDETLRLLRKHGYRPITEDALVISMENKAGALAEVARRFEKAYINLRSLHIIRRRGSKVHVSLVSDDNAAARELVKELLVRS